MALVREHRLYQADWLMRFYGFDHEEIVDDGTGLLRLDVDPKHAWALAHPERFPVDLNLAPREMLLRVPGLGVGSVDKLLVARRVRRLRAEDLKQMKVPARKVLPFVIVDGHRPGAMLSAATSLAARSVAPTSPAASSSATGPTSPTSPTNPTNPTTALAMTLPTQMGLF